ncbi:carbon-nitrogen hydrolase, partial [Planococcus sp. SIMBA_143]
KRLYDARKDLARELNVKSIIIGGRIPNYHKHADEMKASEYVEEVKFQNIYDPVLTFQLMNGFNVMRINPNYLPDDKASKQFATLMEWNNVEYKAVTRRHFRSSFPVRICAIQ